MAHRYPAFIKRSSPQKLTGQVLTIGETQLKEMIHKECDKQRDLMYDEVTMDVLPQLMAVSLYALECRGWRKQRLQTFIDDVVGSYKLLNDGIFGKRFDPADLIEHFKEKYGIDLDAELHTKRVL